MGEELNLRDLGAVLNALKRDGEKIKEVLEKVTNKPHEPQIPPAETQALYLNAAALFGQLPKKHPLREQFNPAIIDGFAQLASNGEYRRKYQEAMEHARSEYVKAGPPCCMKRIADDIADLLAGQGTPIPQEVHPAIVPHDRFNSGTLRAYRINEAADDDGKIVRDSTQALVSWSEEFGQGEVWLNVSPPYAIKGLREKLEEHNLVSVMFIDELYFEYGTPTDHPAHADIKKGREFLEDFFEPCACPDRKGARKSAEHDHAVFDKRYSLENDVVDALKDLSQSIGCKTAKGWKDLAWYAILPAPLAQGFMAHAQHAVRDVLDAHGKPEGIEWNVNSIVYPGGLYIDGKDTIPEEKKGALVIVSCAYDKGKFSPLIYNGNAPPITALVSDIEREIDIQDSLGLMQVHSIKKPDKDWERCQSRLLF